MGLLSFNWVHLIKPVTASASVKEFQLKLSTAPGPIEKLFHALLTVEQPIQLVTITGRNETLKEHLSNIAPPARHKVKVMGFTKEIDELMQAPS